MNEDEDIKELKRLSAICVTGVIVAIILTALSLTGGCSINDKALDTVTAGVNVKYYYENGEPVTFIESAKLSESEKEIVFKALDKAEEIKQKWKKYEDKPITLIQEFNTVRQDYIQIRLQYIRVKEIVINHFKEFDSMQKQQLIDFDNYVQILDNRAEDLEKSINTNQMIKTGLSIIDTTLKIAVML